MSNTKRISSSGSGGSSSSGIKRGHVILIAGAILFIAGIAIAAVWGVSFAGRFLSDNTIVGKTMINPGQSVSSNTEVTQIDRPITLTIGVSRSDGTVQGGQQQQSLSSVRLTETITDPNGVVLSRSEFGNSFVTTVRPHTTGLHTVTITNLGTKPVTVGGTFGYFPIISSNGGKPDVNTVVGAGGQEFGMIIAGGSMATVGVITLIIGGIVTVVDGNNARRGDTAGTTTSEGGITYRKD